MPSKAVIATSVPVTQSLETLSAEAITRIDIKIKLPTPSPSASVLNTSPEPTAAASLLPIPAATPTPEPLPISTPEPTPLPVLVKSIAIEAPISLALSALESLQLSATVKLTDGSQNQSLQWTTSDPEIATIADNGLVQAVSVGKVAIGVHSLEDPSVQDTLELSIINPEVEFAGQIVYVVDNDLYRMQGSNQKPERLTHNGEEQAKEWPRLSWDGQDIVFATRNQIFHMPSDGSQVPTLLNLPENQTAPSPYLSEQDELLFFAKGDPHYGTYKRIWQSNLEAQTPENRVLLEGSSIAGLTPQGQLIAENSGQIQMTSLQEPFETIYFGVGSDARIAHNPQPEQIVYVYKNQIKTVSLSGEKTQITNHDGGKFQPALSPDESQIVFVGLSQGQRDLFLIHRDGTGLVNLTRTININESAPDWSL